MTKAWIRFIAFATCVVMALANEVKLDHTYDNQEVCSGMYSKKDWGGKFTPHIEVKLDENPSQDYWVAIVIFEWKDVDLIGNSTTEDGPKSYICDAHAVKQQLCDESKIGTYIVRNASDLPNSQTQFAPIKTVKLNPAHPEAVNYTIPATGFYCVASYASGDNKYKGTVVFQNAYGYLAASQIPKLSFYGGMALAYLVVLAFWLFQYFRYRDDILNLQKYITAMCGFMVFEMIAIWAYYDYMNQSGTTTFGRIYLIILSVLNSFRTAFSLFMLLIVCLGYGVVRPSLGKLMWKCQALAGIHFLFGTAYTLLSYLTDPEDVDNWSLFVILPLAVTFTVFYIWTLTALNNTTKYLADRKQEVKVRMFRILWRLLMGSLVAIFGFFFLDSFMIVGMSTTDFVESHWKSRWFLLDGWLNIIFFVVFVSIAYIWRPTRDNKRFAMSSQLAQSEDDYAGDFDLDDLQSLEDIPGANAGTGAAGGKGDARDSTDSLGLDAGPSNNGYGQLSGVVEPTPEMDDEIDTEGAQGAKSDQTEGKSGAQPAAQSNKPAGEPIFSLDDEDYEQWSDHDLDDSKNKNSKK